LAPAVATEQAMCQLQSSPTLALLAQFQRSPAEPK
jgi:hypothetical protein